ncbi:MAG: sel1 repeat family protein [Sulfuricella sp.]|nr:sel1 repeat family protein [Sulfuricella sp.]
MKRLLILCLGLSLTACVSVRSTPKPDISAIDTSFPLAAGGQANAQYRLANDHNWYGGAPRGAMPLNDQEAFAWLTLAADQGHADAQLVLARRYIFSSMRDDPDIGIYWAGRAAANANPQACNLLGEVYWQGKHIARDPAEAYKWYFLAANDSRLGQMARELAPEVVAEGRERALAWRKLHPKKL